MVQFVLHAHGVFVQQRLQYADIGQITAADIQAGFIAEQFGGLSFERLVR